MKARTLVPGASIALVASVLLTGCHTDGTVPNEPSIPKPSISQTTEPATPTAPEDFEVGTVIDADTAKLFPRSGDVRAYPLNDGTYVVVNRNAPLPEAVAADLTAKTDAYTATVTADSSMNAFDPDAVIAPAMDGTGKRIILVQKVEGIRTSTDRYEVFYILWGAVPESVRLGSNGGWSTIGEAKAAADAYIATQDTPEKFYVLVPSA